MTNEQILKIFNDFLREHGAYDAYWTNAVGRNENCLPLGGELVVSAVLYCDFWWGGTRQGRAYWSALNSRWVDYWHGLSHKKAWCEYWGEFSLGEQRWRPVFELGLSQYQVDDQEESD